jgi:N-acetylglutamate synthase-like GNAT family acetyltransferase
LEIVKATKNDAQIISDIISNSNKDVAKQFDLNINNAPKHPSFYTKEWVISDFEKDEEYFLFKDKDAFIGCVAFEHPRADTAYLNRLAVLPQYRHAKIGKKLVDHILNYAKSKEVQKVSIGIIAEHEVLKQWYLKLGFKEVSTKTFEHLPFDVTYMKYEFDK